MSAPYERAHAYAVDIRAHVADKTTAAFRARCAADAQSYATGLLNLQDAVDRSQQYAEAFGLVQAIGQDAVQAVMSEAFAAVRDLNPGQSVPNPAPDTADQADAAADSTWDAVLYALRHDGMAALPRQAQRLSELSVRQLESLIAALKRLGGDERLLLSLAELLP